MHPTKKYSSRFQHVLMSKIILTECQVSCTINLIFNNSKLFVKDMIIKISSLEPQIRSYHRTVPLCVQHCISSAVYWAAVLFLQVIRCSLLVYSFNGRSSPFSLRFRADLLSMFR